eukprot:scaffold261962_cov32-Tisochrysis_lutea.AAC.4
MGSGFVRDQAESRRCLQSRTALLQHVLCVSVTRGGKYGLRASQLTVADRWTMMLHVCLRLGSVARCKRPKQGIQG